MLLEEGRHFHGQAGLFRIFRQDEFHVLLSISRGQFAASRLSAYRLRRDGSQRDWQLITYGETCRADWRLTSWYILVDTDAHLTSMTSVDRFFVEMPTSVEDGSCNVTVFDVLSIPSADSETEARLSAMADIRDDDSRTDARINPLVKKAIFMRSRSRCVP